MIIDNETDLIQFDENRTSVTPADHSKEVEIITTYAIRQLAKGVLIALIEEISSHFIGRASGKTQNMNYKQVLCCRNRRRNKRHD